MSKGGSRITAQIEKCTEVTRWPLTLAQGYLAGGRKRKIERPLPVELGQLTLVAEPEGSLEDSEKPGSVT